ncbi:oocyte zinc finger protein XlCOF7.1-like [Ranitomeya variabilis]|uniref:oocyte zinc finger protein XlCOF7.1-like n=1 Tax=Ranitomeya variabilis TaxID=490064 RepID=UPI00405701EB
MWCAALQVEVSTISDPLSGDLLYKRIFLIDPSRMDRDRDKMAETILHLTIEILFHLTGEDYTVVKKTSSERCQAPVSEGGGRPLSPIMGPPPHPLVHENINDQKILELTYKMIELLTGEVPIRCQDVTVYFSMEEWEYLEEHKDLYKDIMMEVPQPLTSPVVSSKRTTPERCPHPLLPHDCKQVNPNVPQNHQGEDLTHINTIETYVRDDEWCKEETPTFDFHPGDCMRSSKEPEMASYFKADVCDITENLYEEHSSIPDLQPAIHSAHLSSDLFQHVLFSDLLQTVKIIKSNKIDVEHERSHNGEILFACSKCGKCYVDKSKLIEHEKIHTEAQELLYSKRQKCLVKKSQNIKHEIHKEKKSFSCSECGARFNCQSKLIGHERIHTGERPFSCLECGKCFSLKANLVDHQKIHTGEKPFSCSECWKCFKKKSDLVAHHRIHTGEKPFLCTECGKCFKQKQHLSTHQKTHTKKNLFSCQECEKIISQKVIK